MRRLAALESPRPRLRSRRLLGAAAAVLVLVALVAGVGTVDLLTTNSAVTAAQRRAATRISGSWAAPPGGRAADPVVPRGVIGLLRIPRFGTRYVRVIGHGTGDAVLDSGDIGHYTGTALPGQIGNMALAGHREADGAALLRITELRRGDRIVVETRTHVFVYLVIGRAQIDPSAVGAIAPVPWHPSATPTKRLLTLQSCTPPLIDTWRYVVWGELASSTRRDPA